MITNKVISKIPAGLSIEADIPNEYEKEIVELALRSILGTLVGILYSPNESSRRAFLLKYVSGILALSESCLKTVQFSHSLAASENTSEIIENLLKSISKGKKK